VLMDREATTSRKELIAAAATQEPA
jgi:hypothetical protein